MTYERGSGWRGLLGYPLWFLTYAGAGAYAYVARDELKWWAFIVLVPLALWLKERVFPSPAAPPSRARQLRDFAVQACDLAYRGVSIAVFWTHFSEWWAVPLGLAASWVGAWWITPSGFHAEVRAELP